GGPIIATEEQTVTVTGAGGKGGGGTFTLTFNGQTTTALAYNATAAQVQAALNALSSVGGVGGSVTVSLANGVYSVAFGGNLRGQDLPLMTSSASGGATATVAGLGNGYGITPEVQQLSVGGASGT